MSGWNTAPSRFLQSTKQILRPNITLLKGFSNHNDSSCALARTNGRSHSFVLEFSFVSFLCFKTKKRKVVSRSSDKEMDFFICSFGLNQKNQKFKPKTK